MSIRFCFVAVLAVIGLGCATPHAVSLRPNPASGCHDDPVIQASTERITWIAPADERNRARLQSWCAGVGSVVYRQNAASGAPALEDLVFVSWNVHVGTGDLEAFVRDLRSGRFTHGRAVTDFVLLIQEAVRVGRVPVPMPATGSGARWIGSEKSAASDIDRMSDELRTSVLYIPSMRNGNDSRGRSAGDRGNAILSTLPLAAPVAIELPGERQRRVAALATIQVKMGDRAVPLFVGATHLDATRPAGNLWILGAAKIRALQAGALVAALPAGAMVLGADLNTWLGRGEPAAAALRNFFGMPATAQGASARLDYMFYRSPSGWKGRYERALNRYGSDHYPLIGSFLKIAG